MQPFMPSQGQRSMGLYPFCKTGCGMKQSLKAPPHPHIKKAPGSPIRWGLQGGASLWPPNMVGVGGKEAQGGGLVRILIEGYLCLLWPCPSSS